MKEDYAKMAAQLHVRFHDEVLNKLPEGVSIPTHNMFDTLVMWVEEMHKEIDSLKAKLEEAEKLVRMIKPPTWSTTAGGV